MREVINKYSISEPSLLFRKHFVQQIPATFLKLCPGMRSAPISSALFSRNRAKLGKLLPDGAVAVVCSNPLMPRNGDQFYPYRQHSDLFYLTGIQQEGSILVMSSLRETLFIRKPDLKTTLWSGPLLTPERASSLSGIGEVRWADELDPVLDEVVPRASSLNLNHSLAPGPENGIQTPDARMFDKMGRIYPERNRSSLSPLMAQLRMVKEPEELEEIKKACSITRSAFSRVLGKLKPGMYEYEVEAELSAEFTGSGAQGHAFEPIVASGKNALVLHYVENNGMCTEGDLLLMDFGAEVNNYAADCTRTVPVGGRFSDRQREIYNAVYRIFLQARSMIVPGVLLGDFHNQVGKLWEEEHIALGLYTRKEANSRPEEDPLWKRYFVHGTSHSLGLDVHDPFDRSVPFQPGMVLTCEPAIYIPGEGLGIRLENDILIGEVGPVDLMEDIPMKAEEIEELLQQNI